MTQKSSFKIQEISHLFILLALIIATLILGRSIIIPFVFAIFIWLLMRKMRSTFDSISFIRKYIPQWLKTLVSTFLLFAIVGLLGKLLEQSLQEIISKFDSYTPNIEKIIQPSTKYFSISTEEISAKISSNGVVFNYISSIVFSLQNVLSNIFIIIIYFFFIVLEESSFSPKMKALFKDEYSHQDTSNLLARIEQSITNYITLKALIALIGSSVCFFIFKFIGISSPLLWSLLIFLFNFIPFVGILVSTLLPTLFAFIQFGEFGPGLIILFVIGSIQFLSGNFIEPRIMGTSLNVSPLAVIVSLAFWGFLWGITGMFLSVPITVVLVIIFSQFPKTKSIAILLSEKGDI